MARKPACLERAGALTPRDRIWALTRALKDFTPAEIMALTGLQLETICGYLRALEKAEPPYLRLADADRPAGRARRECWRYTLLRDTGVEAPNLTAQGKPSLQAQGTVQMWVAMKALREFNTLELAQAASTPDFAVKPGVARNYLRSLALAGYLVAVAKLKSGVRYRFNRAKNTGPRPPIVSSDQSVVDANTGKTVWPIKGEQGCRTQT